MLICHSRATTLRCLRSKLGQESSARLRQLRNCSATACRLRNTGTAQPHLVFTCLLSGQCGSLGHRPCRKQCSSARCPPRSCRSSRTNCHHRYSVRCRRGNPSTIPPRYRSCRTGHRCSGFSALQDEISFRCYRYTIRQNQDYHYQRNGNFDLLLPHTVILQL